MSDDDDLGSLPQLKALTLTGPAYFAAQTLVLIRIQDTKDSLGEDWHGLGLRFLEWCMTNRILSVKSLTSGGGYYEGLFLPEHAEKIRAWLSEQDGQDQSLV